MLQTCEKMLGWNCLENFRNYFTLTANNIATRNNGYLVKLPNVKLAVAKKSFYFQGGKLYNNLPLEIRKMESFPMFCSSLREHFSARQVGK